MPVPATVAGRWHWRFWREWRRPNASKWTKDQKTGRKWYQRSIKIINVKWRRMHFVSDNETHGSNFTALTHFNPMCSSFWCANVDTLYDRFDVSPFNPSILNHWNPLKHPNLCATKFPHIIHVTRACPNIGYIPQKWINMACSTKIIETLQFGIMFYHHFPYENGDLRSCQRISCCDP